MAGEALSDEDIWGNGGASSTPANTMLSDADIWGDVNPPTSESATSSPFGSNRGVAPPNSNSTSDYVKSSGAAIEKLPFWAADMTDALTKGLTRLGGTAYQGLGGDLTPEQAEALTNPKSVHTSQELYQNAGMPLYQPKTSLGTLADLTMSGAAGAASPEVADILASKGIAETNPNSFLASNSSISKTTPEVPPPIDAEALKDTSQKAYKYAEDQGGTLNGEFTGDVRGHLEDAKIQPVGQKPLTKSAEAFNNKIDELMPVEGESWTLDDFQKFDKLLTREKVNQMDGFAHTPDSRALSIAQQKIRDRLQGLAESDVTGGKAGFDALTQEAIPVWSAKTKMDDLERIINRANAMDNPSIAMRTGFRNLMLNKAKMASYPEEVQALIKKAATQTNTDDILGVLGSRLNAIGAGVTGGLPGEIIGHATSKMFRGIRNQRINNRANDVVDALTEPLRPIVNKYSQPLPAPAAPVPSPPMLMLPAPESTIYGNTYGQNIVDTAATRATKEQSPNTASEQIPAENAASNDLIAQNPSKMIKQIGNKRMLGNEEGNLSTRGAAIGGIAGAGGLVLQNAKTPIAPIQQPTKYQTMDALIKDIPELNKPSIPPSFQSEEGFKSSVYKDTTGHKTVGIGFNMDSGIARDVWQSAGINKDFNAVRSGQQQLTKDEANNLLQQSYKIAQQDIKKLVPNIENLPEKAQEGLTQLAFQHGYSSLKGGLPGVIASANQGNMQAAAARLLASDYAKKYRPRALRIARMMAG